MLCVLIMLIPVLLLSSCGESEKSATVTVAGVSTAEKAAGMLTEAYKVKENVKFSVDISETAQAVESVQNGKADIALIDRRLTEEEKSSGLIETAFASHKDSPENVIYIITPAQDSSEAAAGFRNYILSSAAADILTSAGLIPAVE